MHADEMRTDALSERMIGCAFRVLNTPGAGFLEKAYGNALAHETREAGLLVAQQKVITVCYNSIMVGEYVGDLVVEETAVAELKDGKARNPAHTAQCIDHIKATGLHLCLLLNLSRPWSRQAALCASACICGRNEQSPRGGLIPCMARNPPIGAPHPTRQSSAA